MKNRFEGIDLSTEPSLRRMANTVIRQRNEIIAELAEELRKTHPEAADKLLTFKEQLP